MANIIFTNKCNIHCPFCFAYENNSRNKGFENFDILESWQISSYLSNKKFRFCGGEPTLNPSIIKVVESLLKNGNEIFFMTNGIWPQKFSDYVSNIDTKYYTSIAYLFNILEPKLYKNNEFATINKNLKIVNPMKSTLGFTIYLEKFEYQYLLDLVEKYDIRKIRWSVAAPNISSLKTSIEAFYSSISDRLFDLYDYCLKNKIHIHGDCNYIQPCFWKTDKISNLLIRASGNLRFSCGNGSPVDIDVTGNAWRCYGLFKILKAKTSDFKNEVELEGYFNRRIGLLDNMAAFKECLECDYWKNGCFGGCYVFRIKRALKKVPNLVLFPIDDNTEILKCKPHINMNFKLVDNLESVKIISANKVIVNENENVIDFLKEIDGKKSLYELIKKWENNFSNFDIAKNTIIEQCRELFEKDMIRLNYDYPVKIENRNECFNNKNE